jgi:hypothetical protein
MASVNLPAEALDPYKRIVSQDPSISWVVYGYERNSNDLKVDASGGDGSDGPLEESKWEYSDGKMQYAFVRVKDPTTGLNKYVLVCWVSTASLLIDAFANCLFMNRSVLTTPVVWRRSTRL